MPSRILRNIRNLLGKSINPRKTELGKNLREVLGEVALPASMKPSIKATTRRVMSSSCSSIRLGANRGPRACDTSSAAVDPHSGESAGRTLPNPSRLWTRRAHGGAAHTQSALGRTSARTRRKAEADRPVNHLLVVRLPGKRDRAMPPSAHLRPTPVQLRRHRSSVRAPIGWASGCIGPMSGLDPTRRSYSEMRGQ